MANPLARTLASMAVLCLMAFVTVGCSAQAIREKAQRDRMMLEKRDREERAARLYEQGAAALAAGQIDIARENFLDAIALNPDLGPAHNDLGTIYLRQGNLARAAVEFDIATRHMPGRYDPYYNLGLTWEQASRLREAADAYRQALRLAPDNLAAMENLARVNVKMGVNEQETIELLERALVRESRPEWQQWIRLQLYRLRGSPTTQSATGAP